MKLSPWQLSLAALVVCALALAAAFGYRNGRLSGHDWLFRRLPTDHAVIVGIDVDTLRQTGLLDLLAGPKAAEELDYRRFVDQTGFDYRRDLDYVAASVSVNSSSKHFLLNGRFDWKAMFDTARRAGGRCQNTFCDLPGFAAGRNLSFLPLSEDTLGLSISAGPQAAWGLAQDSTGVPLPSIPVYPFFLAMDAAILSPSDWVPAGLRPLTDVLSTADYVVLGIHAGDADNLEIALDADCMSEARAAMVKEHIEQILGPASATLTLLHGGTFRTEGRSVRGRWTLERNAVQSLVSP